MHKLITAYRRTQEPIDGRVCERLSRDTRDMQDATRRRNVFPLRRRVVALRQ